VKISAAQPLSRQATENESTEFAPTSQLYHILLGFIMAIFGKWMQVDDCYKHLTQRDHEN
jgi:hypothetical protein